MKEDCYSSQILFPGIRVEGGHYVLLKSDYEMAQEFDDYDKLKEIDKIVTWISVFEDIVHLQYPIYQSPRWS